MAKRWRLSDASSLVDVGCGPGHCSMLLYPSLKPRPRWSRSTRRENGSRKLLPKLFAPTPVNQNRFTFKRGEANALPLPSDKYDVVTSQTVLMHLGDLLVPG